MGVKGVLVEKRSLMIYIQVANIVKSAAQRPLILPSTTLAHAATKPCIIKTT